MKQITKEQAIAIGKSEVWKTWTDEEIVKFQLYQDKLAVPFSRFHQAVEKVLGHPVWTHEFGLNYQGLVQEYEGKKAKPSFEEIMGLIPKEKLILVVPTNESEAT